MDTGDKIGVMNWSLPLESLCLPLMETWSCALSLHYNNECATYLSQQNMSRTAGECCVGCVCAQVCVLEEHLCACLCKHERPTSISVLEVSTSLHLQLQVNRISWGFKKAAVKGFCVSWTCRLLMAPCSAFWGVLVEGIRVTTCTEELLEGILLPQMISFLLVKQPRGTGIGCWCCRSKQHQVPLTCWEQILRDTKVWLMRI